MKAALIALTASLLAVPAFAAAPAAASGTQWASASMFVGQTRKPTGQLALTWYPAIFSTSTDASGNYEVWVQYKPYYQESYADHKALQERASCNETGDNSCVNGQAQWHEVLIANPIVK